MRNMRDDSCVDVAIQCDGFCICNIMSRMSGYAMSSNGFTILLDRVLMQGQSIQTLFQSLLAA